MSLRGLGLMRAWLGWPWRGADTRAFNELGGKGRDSSRRRHNLLYAYLSAGLACSLLPEALAVLPSQLHHLLETVIALGKAECPLPILFSPLLSSDGISQLCKLVLQRFHTLFQRLRHAGNIDRCPQDFHKEMRSPPSPLANL